MLPMTRLLVWAEAEQDAIVRDTIAVGGFELVGIGAADADAARRLADAFDVPRLGDLRQAIVLGEADLVWIAARDPIEADERRALRDRGLCCVSTEPRPVDLADFMRDADEARTARTIPLLRYGSAWRSAADARAEFGVPVAVHVTCAGTPEQGSLAARLFDAMDVISALGLTVETVDADFSAPVREALHGHLAALVRGTTVRASILASDASGAWRRSVTLLGPRGTLHLDDGGYTWHDASGATAEDYHVEDDGSIPSAPALFAEQMRRRLDNLDAAAEPPDDLAARLTLCAAARLSGRTRQPEAPDNLRRMLERV